MAPTGSFNTTLTFGDSVYPHEVTLSVPEIDILRNQTVSTEVKIMFMFGFVMACVICFLGSLVVLHSVGNMLIRAEFWALENLTGDHTQCVKTGTKHSHLLCNMKWLLSFLPSKRPYWRHRPDKKVVQINVGNEKGFGQFGVDTSDDWDTLTSLQSVRTSARHYDERHAMRLTPPPKSF